MTEVQHMPAETMTTPTDLDTAGAEQVFTEPATTPLIYLLQKLQMNSPRNRLTTTNQKKD